MAKAKTWLSRKLSSILQEVGDEETEFIDKKTDGGELEPVMVTKLEALARIIWKKALGGKERKVDDDGNVTITEREPNASFIQLIYDRLEGRAPQALNDSKDKLPIQDRISEQRVKALNDLGKKP